MRRLVVAAALLALASAPIPTGRSVTLVGPAARTAAPRSVLAAVASPLHRSAMLVRLDARTLERLPQKGLPIRLLPAATAWSADHRLVALAGQLGPVGTLGASWPAAPELRVVDPTGWRVVSATRLLPLDGVVDRVSWLGSSRVVALAHRHDAYVALVVDVRSGRIERGVPLQNAAGTPLLRGWFAAASGRGVVGVLLDSAPGLSPVTLLLIRPSGVLRLGLPDVFGGIPPVGAIVSPGLAIAPDGSRAYAQSPGGPIQEVDLRTDAVTLHRPTSGSPSLLRRVARALQPAAYGKALSSASTCLAVTPAGQLLSTGERIEPDVPGGIPAEHPAGLTLIDPATWSSTLLSADVSRVRLAGSAVLGVEPGGDRGLLALRPGAPAVTLLAGTEVGFLPHVGRLAYAPVAGRRYAVIDAADASVVGSGSGRAPWTIVSDDDASTC